MTESVISNHYIWWVAMTKDELTRLDNYGHKELDTLDEIELREYATLLKMRRQEVFERISTIYRLRKSGAS